MIPISIGVDIVEIKRFKEIALDNKFYNQNFDKIEMKYCLKFKDPYVHLAGKFAVKESFQKAVKKSIPMKDIHTRHGKFGEPILFCKKIQVKKIEVSISHEKHYAIAVSLVIL
jgi:holo-[acyl-carrier protein] synthase